MHDAVIEWCRRWQSDAELFAIDIGGQDVNGHARHVWPNAVWLVIDQRAGPGVDMVIDAASWRGPTLAADLVLCTEVFEHTPQWARIVANAHGWLSAEGVMIVTCAAPNRAPHRLGLDDDTTAPGWYQNIAANELAAELAMSFEHWVVRHDGEDLRAIAWDGTPAWLPLPA